MRIVSTCGGLLAVAIFSLTCPSVSWAQCFNVPQNQWEACPGCAYSFCECAYVGADCPSVRITCNTRNPADSGIFEVSETPTQPCSYQRPCKSQNGGACGVNNPCVTCGAEVQVGQMIKYSVIDLCGIIT